MLAHAQCQILGTFCRLGLDDKMLMKHQKPVIVYSLVGEQRLAGSEAWSIKADLFFLSSSSLVGQT